MVLSIIIATIAAPALLGSQEAIRQGQSKEKREEHRARRCNLIATCVKSSLRSREINGRPVVLKNQKLWIDTGSEEGSPLGHTYAGYYLPYPESNYEGLVTTITDEAPIMNWVYVDKNTHEIKYGVRADAQPNLTGPFDCTRQDRRLTFDGWEGWCAVEEYPGLWALYFDVGDDGLKAKLAPGTRVLEIELSRKEKRFQKEAGARQQDQTTKREVDAKENAPVDQPLAAEELVQRPGVVDTRSNNGSASSEPFSPFKIPKSIFNDTPLVLEPQAKDSRPKSSKITESFVDHPPPPTAGPLPETPKTPPPAYSTTILPQKPVGSPLAMSMNEVLDKFSSPKIKQDGQRGAPQPLSNDYTSPIPFDSTLSTPVVTSGSKNSSQVTPPQSKPLSEKHSTPRLNRNSGTRALAQAHMFEAMAAGPKPSDTIQRESGKRTPQFNNSVDFRPKLSSDGRMSIGELRPDSVLLPLQTSPKQTATEPLATKAQAGVLWPQASVTTKRVQRPDPPIWRPSISPHQTVPLAVANPARFGEGSPKSLRSSSPSRPVPISRTPKSYAQRSPSQSLDRSTSISRSRRETANNQSPVLNDRTLWTATMTTGRTSQGMANQIFGAKGRTAPGPSRPFAPQNSGGNASGRKTTSALFRDIDDLISQDVKGPADDDAHSRLRRSKTMPTNLLGDRYPVSHLMSSNGRKDRPRIMREGSIRNGPSRELRKEEEPDL